jgi:hypothetical protein
VFVPGGRPIYAGVRWGYGLCLCDGLRCAFYRGGLMEEMQFPDLCGEGRGQCSPSLLQASSAVSCPFVVGSFSAADPRLGEG